MKIKRPNPPGVPQRERREIKMIKASEAHEKSVENAKINRYLSEIEDMINKAIERGEFKIIYNHDLSPVDGYLEIVIGCLKELEYKVKEQDKCLVISW